MSFDAKAWADSLGNYAANTRRWASVLAAHADEDGIVNASTKAMQYEAGLTYEERLRAMLTLQELGMAERLPTDGRDGSRYQLRHGDLTKLGKARAKSEVPIVRFTGLGDAVPMNESAARVLHGSH